MDKHLHDLIEDLKQGKQIALFLGSGVNYSPQKKMLWDDVLHEFINKALPLLNLSPDDIDELRTCLDPLGNDKSVRQSYFSTESIVSVIKKLLGNDYIPLLQNIIYTQATPEILSDGCNKYVKQNSTIKNTPFYTLFVVAELILRYENIRAIVTYNFDNLLTQAILLLRDKTDYFCKYGDSPRLNRNDFRPIDIYNGWADEPFAASSFPIYHPHGYIQPPCDLIPNSRNKVVMAMEEFYESARDTYSWQQATQLHFLTHYTCVYMGASLTDMNMQRLISFANIKYNNESVYYIMIINNALDRLKSIFHSTNHLKVVSAKQYQDIYNELLK
ncbi:MAG: SIR2 family protein [Bacteroidales bacterium]|nr:SIR2 family protein [Bacteroidales bacterium]